VTQTQIVSGVAAITVVILSVVPRLHGNESAKVGVSNDATSATFAPNAHVSLPVPLRSGENFRFGAATESPAGEPSASELNRKLALGQLGSRSRAYLHLPDCDLRGGLRAANRREY